MLPLTSVAGLAAVACTPPSARQPSPQERPPVAPAATPGSVGGGRSPAPLVPGAAGTSRAIGAFTYAPGSYRYVVTSEATVEVWSDSGGQQQQRRSEPVASRLVVDFRVAARGAEGARVIAGTVDSFTVTRGAGATAAAAAPPPLQPAPVAFRGTLDPTRTRLELHVGTSAAPARVAAGGDCNSPNEAVLVLAREAIALVPPGVLVAGRAWDDSTSSTVCRGDVPLTVRAVHHYRVEGVERRGAADAVRLTRTSETTVEGQGTQRGLPITVSGRGSARADLYLDATAGRFLGGEGESTLELDLQTPERAPQRVVQRGRTRVEEP